MNDRERSRPTDGIRAPPNTPISLNHPAVYPGNVEHFSLLTADGNDDGEVYVLGSAYYVHKDGDTLPIGTIKDENGDIVLAGGCVKGRKLVPWHFPRMFEKVLFHMIYELTRQGVAIPYDDIANRLDPGSSGNALIQALNKQRDQLLAEGHLIPPTAQRDDPLAGIIRGYVRDFNQKCPFISRVVYWVERMPNNPCSLIPSSVVVGSGNNKKAIDGAMGMGRTKRAWRDEEQDAEDARAAAVGEEPRTIRRDRTPPEQKLLEAMLKSGKKLSTVSSLALPAITPGKRSGRKNGKAIPVKRAVIVKKSSNGTRGIKRAYDEFDDESFEVSDEEEPKPAPRRARKTSSKKGTRKLNAIWDQLNDSGDEGRTYAQKFAAFEKEKKGVNQTDVVDQPSNNLELLPVKSAADHQNPSQEVVLYGAGSDSNGFGTPGLGNNDRFIKSSPGVASPAHGFDPLALNGNNIKYEKYAADVQEELLRSNQCNMMNFQANGVVPYDAGVVGPMIATNSGRTTTRMNSFGGFGCLSSVSGFDTYGRASQAFDAADYGRGIDIPPPQFNLPGYNSSGLREGYMAGNMHSGYPSLEELDPDYTAEGYAAYRQLLERAALPATAANNIDCQTALTTNTHPSNQLEYAGIVTHSDITAHHAAKRPQSAQSALTVGNHLDYNDGAVQGYY